jgi:predicted RNase H-like HicB family nuclease
MSKPEEAYLTLSWSWVIAWDDDAGGYVVTIEELPDFFAAGHDAMEAGANAREAFLSHIAGYIATGTAIPTPTPALTPHASNRSDVLQLSFG